jgi:TPR repeat protein
MYDRGERVPVDDEKAVFWYRLSADQVNAVAQNNLGAMYYSGNGVNEGASDNLALAAKAMKRGDVNQGRRLAKQWLKGFKD